jgi:hypothetical protein
MVLLRVHGVVTRGSSCIIVLNAQYDCHSGERIQSQTSSLRMAEEVDVGVETSVSNDHEMQGILITHFMLFLRSRREKQHSNYSTTPVQMAFSLIDNDLGTNLDFAAG